MSVECSLCLYVGPVMNWQLVEGVHHLCPKMLRWSRLPLKLNCPFSLWYNLILWTLTVAFLYNNVSFTILVHSQFFRILFNRLHTSTSSPGSPLDCLAISAFISTGFLLKCLGGWLLLFCSNLIKDPKAEPMDKGGFNRVYLKI